MSQPCTRKPGELELSYPTDSLAAILSFAGVHPEDVQDSPSLIGSPHIANWVYPVISCAGESAHLNGARATGTQSGSIQGAWFSEDEGEEEAPLLSIPRMGPRQALSPPRAARPAGGRLPVRGPPPRRAGFVILPF